MVYTPHAHPFAIAPSLSVSTLRETIGRYQGGLN